MLDFSLIIPTLNEAENLPLILPQVADSLSERNHEIIVVDDGSTDGTQEAARGLMRKFPQLRMVERLVQPSLSASIFEGFENARGKALGVMDADLQHDPSVLPRLLDQLRSSDIVLGSRYVDGGSILSWNARRESQSRLAAGLTRRLLRLSVSDPLSGLFAVRNSVFQRLRGLIHPRGWKLLLDFLAYSDPMGLRIAEIPYDFRPRAHGKTKMRPKVVLDWLCQAASLAVQMRGSVSLLPTPRRIAEIP